MTTPRTYVPVPGGPTPADLPDAGAITPKVAEPGIPTTRPAPMNSLLAAATRLTGASLLASRTHRTGSAEQWQEDAWEMYDLVGELRFLATVIAATGAKARFYVGTLSDDPTDPPVPTEDQELIDALEAIGDGPSGLSQLVRRLLINLYVPGDGWLVGIPKALMPENRQEGAPPPARGDGVVILDDLVWRMLSVSEVKFESDDMILSLGVGKDQEVRARADDLYPIRVWNPHPRRSWEADSPTRSSLPVLRELVGLTMHISAQIDSRLAGAGIIIAPDSAARAARRAAGLPEDGPDDPFTDALIKAMMTPISDRAGKFKIRLPDVKRNGQRHRVCHGGELPLDVNLPSLIVYSLLATFLLDIARMRPSPPLMNENCRVWFSESNLTTSSSDPSAFLVADVTRLESLASPNSRS